MISFQNALHAVQRGAFDYYLKPVNLEELRLILERACRLSRLDREAFGDVTMPAASAENVEILGGQGPLWRCVEEVSP